MTRFFLFYIMETKTQLFLTMRKIDSIPLKRWIFARNMCNNFDFIHSRKIVSRAYYKLWEMLSLYHIGALLPSKFKCCHLAEAPGGFTQAIYDKFGNRITKCIAISKPPSTYRDVLMTSRKIPIFSKSINRNVILKYIDICDEDSFIDDDKYDFITADGGIDDGNEYENKECLHNNLIFHEINHILSLQKKGGCCILKFFETFTERTIVDLWNLRKHYSFFDIVKPLTSRPTNSERYMVCYGFGTPNHQKFEDFKSYILRQNNTLINSQIHHIETVLDFDQRILNVNINKKEFTTMKIWSKKIWEEMCG